MLPSDIGTVLEIYNKDVSLLLSTVSIVYII